MKKIYPSKMWVSLISLMLSIAAFAKKQAAAAIVSGESGNPSLSLMPILSCVAVGVTTKRSANYLLTAKPVHGRAGFSFSPFIQFTRLEFRSLN